MKPVVFFAVCLAATPLVAVATQAVAVWCLERWWLPKIAGRE